MDDLGAPSSYLTLADGIPVYSSDGQELGRVEHVLDVPEDDSCDGERVGKVEHVLAAPEEDIFDGIVLDASVLPGGHRFVDAPQVEEIYERGVVLKLDAAAAEDLPQPSANPAVMQAGPDDLVPDGSHEKLRRAWDLISGKG
jgi:hypothetical protein